MTFENDKVCKTCQLKKQSRSFFKSKNIVTTIRPLEFFCMDLF